MSNTLCEDRRDALAAAAVGDLAGEELTELQSHVAGCTGCAVYQSSLEAAVGVLRDDASASPSAERRARVVAAARAVSAAPRIVPFTPARGGLGGLLGAAAAAVLAFVLFGPNTGGGAGINDDLDLFKNVPTATVVHDGATFVRTDSATGVVTLLTTHANVTSRAMEGETLQVGTLEIRFPSDYRGPSGRQRIATPGGTVTVEATPGARYLLEQWPGEAYVETGALTATSKGVSGDTGQVSLRDAAKALSAATGLRIDVTDDAAVHHTRLTVTGATPDTCYALLAADARHAGLQAGLVNGVRTITGTPSRETVREPQARREGSLFVEVHGQGRALVEAAGGSERFEAREGVQVMLTGRSTRTWNAPTAEVRATLERRIRVVGAGAASAAAVSLDSGDAKPIATGTTLLGYTVRHVGANGITLERNNTLVRIGIAGQ